MIFLCLKSPRQKELIVCRAKPTDQLRQETWDMGQLQLRQQTKRFSSLKAASPTVPRQGIWFTVPLNSESNLKSTWPTKPEHMGKMHSSTNSPAYRGIWTEKTVLAFHVCRAKLMASPEPGPLTHILSRLRSPNKKLYRPWSHTIVLSCRKLIHIRIYNWI